MPRTVQLLYHGDQISVDLSAWAPGLPIQPPAASTLSFRSATSPSMDRDAVMFPAGDHVPACKMPTRIGREKVCERERKRENERER